MNADESEKTFLLKEIGKCRSCRFCVDVCPTYQASSGLESMSAFGRLQMIKYLLNGTLAFDNALTFFLYTCLQCRRCEIICKDKGQNLDACDLIQRGRSLLSPGLAEGGGNAAI